MTPPFKSLPGQNLSNNKTAFNTLLAKPRVKSEHCIGILKGRFPFFKGMRMRLGNKTDMKRIIDHVRAGVVLHNFLISDEIDADWIAVDDEEDVGPEPVTNRSIRADDTRRSELFYYLSQLEETTIN